MQIPKMNCRGHESKQWESMSQFSKEESDEVLRIRCPANIDGVAARDFATQAKAWMLSSAQNFVIDMTGVLSISREFYQVVIQLKSNLKRDQKTVYSVNVSPNLLKQIKIDGVDQALNSIGSEEQIFSNKSSETSKGYGFDVAFLNSFLVATLKALEVQCKTKVTALKPALKVGPLPNVAIAGVLSLMSNEFSGSIVLCFSQSVFLRIYENMFDEKHEQITAEIEDAAGEILNIIYGLAKIELNQKGYNFQKALPTVLAGEKMKIRQSSSTPAIVVPFETEAGAFHIEIEFNKT